ncbi:hypothetical protein EVAR_71929_1 [Eumeta japonica]|uniref:Uncharacterized protein n=1 Tax=Eumeta variegata TaxID=151549 RepID=A0A4C1SV97_EUMVA|nr:hypothetical protein EVAR_71929_1 [Eumeta japonica]
MTDFVLCCGRGRARTLGVAWPSQVGRGWALFGARGHPEREHKLLILKKVAFVALSLASAVPETKTRSRRWRDRFSIRRSDCTGKFWEQRFSLTSSMGFTLETPQRTL